MTTTKSIPKFSALRLKRSGQGTGYGERNKTKGSKISTGPTTSGRHSKKKTKGTHFSTGPTTSSRHSKKKTKGTHFSTGPTTSSRHSKILNYRLCLRHCFVGGTISSGRVQY